MSAGCNTVFVVQLLIVVAFVLFGPKPASLYVETPYERTLQSKNTIVQENLRKGTRIWWSNQTDVDPQIEGFTTQFSYQASDTAIFKIMIASELFDSMPFIRVQLWIFRMGFYSGLGGALAGNISFTETITQPNCLYEISSRMVDCDNWRESVKWPIPPNSVTGIYIAIPVIYKEENGKQVEVRGTYIPFVVRQSDSNSKITHQNPERKLGSDILFKTSDMTWVIYNKYGGWNLYRGNGTYTFDSRASKASYNRPFQNRQYKPQGQFENFLFGAEYPLLFWLEKHGFDVSYASCNDIENMNKKNILHPENYRILLSVGHDEYYTQELRNSYMTARENGVNLAFLSANEMFWRTRWDNEKQIITGVQHVRTFGHGNLSLSYFTSEYDDFNRKIKTKFSNIETLNRSNVVKNEKRNLNEFNNGDQFFELKKPMKSNLINNTYALNDVKKTILKRKMSNDHGRNLENSNNFLDLRSKGNIVKNTENNLINKINKNKVK